MKVLVTGATGYVGGRLIPRLLKRGVKVRACGRNLAKLQGRYWAKDKNVEIVACDVLDYNSLANALEGCDVAYYLVHSMVREVSDFERTDREAALNFVAAAESSSLKRIIYLGGLGNEKDKLSKHLQSRREVGEIFRTSSIPVTIFRAAMIIGSGSASFEILRYLVDRLPIMVTPKWVRTPCQPISIINVLEYLIRALDVQETIGQTFDIGGPEVTTYQDLMDTYAAVMGLKRRRVFPVKPLSPWLSSHWIGLVTPLPPKLGKPLAEGLSNKVVCEDTRILKLIPQKLLTCKEAIEKAVDKTQHNRIETSWTDAGTIPAAEWIESHDPRWAGGTLFEEGHHTTIQATPKEVWRILLKVGGKTGWFSPNWLWRLRGWIDKRVGGVGLSRGRRNTDKLQVGDAVDFWRVHLLEPNRRLLLVAEMKVPGEAALEFRIDPLDEKTSELTVKARFLPKGLWGILYWYAVAPFHSFIFTDMLVQITEDVKQELRRD